MDGDTTFLRVRDLVERTGLPEADVKRSLRIFGEFFISSRQGRARLYSPDTVEQLKQIAELEAMGTTTPTIRGILRGGKAGAGTGDDTSPATTGRSAASAGENLTLGVLSDIKNLQEALGDLREQVSSLQEKVAEHEQRLIGHQQQVRLLRRDLDDQKTESLARRMEERNTPLWNRLFPGKGGLRR
jgi:DNA-binding transcriptional MerR regulator